MQEEMSFCEEKFVRHDMPFVSFAGTDSVNSGDIKEEKNTKMHKNGTFICKCHFFCSNVGPPYL